MLVLIGLALFIAAGLDPAVSWLTRRRLPRWAAVLAVVAAAAAVLTLFILAAIPPVASQTKLLAMTCRTTCTRCAIPTPSWAD